MKARRKKVRAIRKEISFLDEDTAPGSISRAAEDSVAVRTSGEGEELVFNDQTAAIIVAHERGLVVDWASVRPLPRRSPPPVGARPLLCAPIVGRYASLEQIERFLRGVLVTDARSGATILDFASKWIAVLVDLLAERRADLPEITRRPRWQEGQRAEAIVLVESAPHDLTRLAVRRAWPR